MAKYKALCVLIFLTTSYIISRVMSAEVSPSVLKNRLRFPYGTGFVYHGKLKHSLERCWVVKVVEVTRFDQIPFLELKYDPKCDWVREQDTHNNGNKKQLYESIMTKFCISQEPRYNMIIDRRREYQKALRNIFVDELYTLLPDMNIEYREKRKETFKIGRHKRDIQLDSDCQDTDLTGDHSFKGKDLACSKDNVYSYDPHLASEGILHQVKVLGSLTAERLMTMVLKALNSEIDQLTERDPELLAPKNSELLENSEKYLGDIWRTNLNNMREIIKEQIRNRTVEIPELGQPEEAIQALDDEFLGNKTLSRKKRIAIMGAALGKSIIVPALKHIGTNVLQHIAPKLVKVGLEKIGSWLGFKRDVATAESVKVIKELEKKRILQENLFMKYERDLTMLGKFTLDNIQGIVDTINEMKSDRTHTIWDRFMNGDREGWSELYYKDVPDPYNMMLWGNHVQGYADLSEEKFNHIYEDLIIEGRNFIKGIAKAKNGYPPIEILPPEFMRNVSEAVNKMLLTSHPNYKTAIEPTHLYNLPILSTTVDKESHKLIMTLPYFIQERNQQEMTLYHIETVPVPIEDMNQKANSFTQIKIQKPYIAINDDYYIHLSAEDLENCYRMSYNYYCEALFLVRHKTKHTCESALFFNLPDEIIKQNCEFEYMFNTTVTPAILDGGQQLVLANMDGPNELMCTDANNLGEPIANHPYVLVNRSILCNCRFKSGYTYLYRSLGSCEEESTSDAMHFTINKAFHHYYLDMINKTNTLHIDTDIRELPLKTTEEQQQFQIYLEDIRDPLTLDPPTNLKELVHFMEADYGIIQSKDNNTVLNDDTMHLTKEQIEKMRNIYIDESERAKFKVQQKIPFLNSWETQLLSFITSVLTVLLIALTCLFVSKHVKLAAVVGSMALHRMPHASAAPIMSDLSLDTQPKQVVCQSYTMTLIITVISLIAVVVYILKIITALRFCKGYRYRHACTLYIFASRGDRYIPLKLITLTGHITNFTIDGKLTKEDITFISNWWDTLQIDWSNVSVKYEDKELTMPTDLAISWSNKMSARYILLAPNPKLTFMIRQGNTWYNIQDNKYLKQPAVDLDTN